jgi:hypothetical protein
MAEQMRPASPKDAPDPATAYERAKPHKEAGQGRLDNNGDATPTNSPDRTEDAVKQKQPLRQINAEDAGDDRSARPLAARPVEKDRD